MVFDQLAHPLKKLIRCKRFGQRGNIVEQPVGIRHWLTNMQDWQSRSLATDQPDELSVRNGAPPGIGDYEFQIGKNERQYAGRVSIKRGENSVTGAAKCVDQQSHEFRIVVGDHDLPRSLNWHRGLLSGKAAGGGRGAGVEYLPQFYRRDN